MDLGLNSPISHAWELWLGILSYVFMHLGLLLFASEPVSMLFACIANTFFSPPMGDTPSPSTLVLHLSNSNLSFTFQF